MALAFSQILTAIATRGTGRKTASMATEKRRGSRTSPATLASSRTARRMVMASTHGPTAASSRVTSSMAYLRARERTTSQMRKKRMLESSRMRIWRATGKRCGKTAAFTQVNSCAASSTAKAP